MDFKDVDLDEIILMMEDSLEDGNPEKMFTFLRGYFDGAHMHQSMEALGFARDSHAGQTRQGDLPYIIHPLCMACYAIGIKICDDKIIAAMLLHDVPEETGISFSSLPVDDEVRLIVDCMTIQPYPNETKWQCKERYFNGLLRHPGAIICKCADRFDNLGTMEGIMPLSSIENNVIETKYLLLPITKAAKDKWPSLYDHINTYRHNIKVLCRMLYNAHNVKAKEKEIIQKMMTTPAHPKFAVPQTNQQTTTV